GKAAPDLRRASVRWSGATADGGRGPARAPEMVARRQGDRLPLRRGLYPGAGRSGGLQARRGRRRGEDRGAADRGRGRGFRARAFRQSRQPLGLRLRLVPRRPEFLRRGRGGLWDEQLLDRAALYRARGLGKDALGLEAAPPDRGAPLLSR